VVSSTPATALITSVEDFESLAWDPAGDRLASATGPAVVVVDIDDPMSLVPQSQSRHRTPCVTVARCSSATWAPALERFDVLATPETDPPRPFLHDDGLVERIVDTVIRRPRASVVLAQLLRLSEPLSIDDALVAESLAYSTLLAGPEFQGWLADRGDQATILAPVTPLVVTREDDVLSIRLERPDVHNAFSAAMRDALVEALAIAVADDGIRRVVLSGAGPSFCSGGDLSEFGTATDPATAHLVRTSRSPARLIAGMHDRVEARTHGACIGAGVELAAFARRVTAAPETWFQLPEVLMGLVPGAGGTVSLPRRIGRHRTVAMALSGDKIDSETALVWGLADELTPHAQDPRDDNG
jgi:enoyl-CoA hydratase/carnithine racemase